MIYHEFLPQGRTVNKEYCLEFMRRLRQAIRQKCTELWKNQSWILYHSDAPDQTSMLVRNLFGQNQNRNHTSTTVFTGLGPGEN